MIHNANVVCYKDIIMNTFECVCADISLNLSACHDKTATCVVSVTR